MENILIIIIILIVGIPFLLIAVSLGINNKLKLEQTKVDIKGKNISNIIEKKLKTTSDFIQNNQTIFEKNPLIIPTISNFLERFNQENTQNSLNINDNLNIIQEEIKTTIDNQSKDYLTYLEELQNLDSSLNYSETIYNEIITKYNNILQKFPYNIVAKLFGYKKISLINIKD
jgi:LemA protein